MDNIGNIWMKNIYSLKNNISNTLNKNLDNEESELLKGMIYGDTRNLDEDIKEIFSNIGISHITAVSGSNLNTLLVILSIMLCKVKKHKKIYIIFQILCVAIFCTISGFELSLLRASIMSEIVIVCKYLNKKISIEKLLIISLAVMIAFNPFRIYNIGMTGI